MLSLLSWPGGCPTSRSMTWAQTILLVRALSRGWGGIGSAALRGAPFSQVTTSQAVITVEGSKQAGLGSAPKSFRIHPVKSALWGLGWPICSQGQLNVSHSFKKVVVLTCMRGLNLKIRMYELSRFGWWLLHPFVKMWTENWTSIPYPKWPYGQSQSIAIDCNDDGGGDNINSSLLRLFSVPGPMLCISFTLSHLWSFPFFWVF